MIEYQFNTEIVPKTQQEFVRSLLNSKDFSQSDRLLGFAKGRGITWFLHTNEELGMDCVRRHYYRGGLFGKLVKDRYLFTGLTRTRAAQEFQLLQKMQQWGLPVPRPIAFRIQRKFGTYQADILLEKMAKTQDLSHYLQQQPLDNFAYQQIGQLIRKLHQHQVHHSDLNIHNILRDENGKFWLIDFDKCRIQSGEKWKADNLARLLRSFQKEQQRLGIRFEPQNWEALLVGYESEIVS